MTRVLVVEDDAQTAAEIAAALGDHGFEVECAHTGQDALDRAVADRYSAIVLDRMLPGGIDGLTVLSTLRGLSVDAPVLILSALSAVDERVRGLRAGEYVRIWPGMVHRMIALSDCDVLEASTPELEDVVRLEDRYGRK